MVSKKLFSALAATAVILAMLGASGVAFAQAPTTSTAPAQANRTIAQLAANNTNLSTFVSLLTKANLISMLNRSGNFTLFAPTNAAFARMDNLTLENTENNATALKLLLEYHIVRSRVYAINFTGSGGLTTGAGATLPYAVNIVTGIRVDNATVTTYDINATNGVMHIIDSVMIPPPQATAASNGGFLGLPGFEFVYAGAALTAAGYLTLRRRK